MKKKIYFLMGCCMVFMACQPSVQNNKPHLDIKMVSQMADSNYTIADLAIEGMMCAHACGGKVQQELRKIAGVKNTSLDFIEERKVNVVHVQFDPAVVDEQKMITAVNSIVDGKYTVVSAQRTAFVKP
jgi:copper chaperone CopZ